MWLFDSPKNYLEMVEKIAKSVFFVTLFALFFISSINQEFGDMLKKLSFGVEYYILGNIKLNMAIFYIPMLAGFTEHAFHIHDKLSTIFKIREKFDRDVIIEMIAIDVLDADNEKYKENIREKLEKTSKKEISQLMGEVFYPYASSTKPTIDEHYIHMALGSWCWYWIFLDTLFIILITGLVYLLQYWEQYCNLKTLGYCITFIVPYYIVLKLLKTAAKNCAVMEVKAILHNHDAKVEIYKTIRNWWDKNAL